MEIYKEKQAELLNLCQELEGFDGYGLNRELFDEFYKNGNRLRYENEYFAKRSCLTARAVKAIVADNGIADAKLTKIINAVCNEFTWALPAHVERNTENPEQVIDLFCAETAQTLSEIMNYVKLPKALCDKIYKLLYERIITPYESGSFWWETSEHNWAAVCSGCIGMVYMRAFPERFPIVKDRILNTMSCFLSGYGDDGACLEGLGYWGYGFGYFVYFASLLRSFDGTDLLSEEKVARIAEFQGHMFLKNGVSVSFSDSSRSCGFNIGLACFLKKEFGERIKIPDIRCRRDLDECRRFAPYLRSFLWFDERLIAQPSESFCEKYFADAQLYINKRGKFAFAAKGGNNGEPHNHNDIGCFIIADGAQQLITDLGAGEYTRGYFNDEKRYEYFCASSRGHSVPIIDGEYQKSGDGYRAEPIKAGNNEFMLDISGAYGSDKLRSLVRSFKISDNKVILRDTLDLSGEKITERLVSLIKPEGSGGNIKIKDMTIHSRVIPEVAEVTVKNHEGEDETVYTIDYEVSSDNFECEFIFG